MRMLLIASLLAFACGERPEFPGDAPRVERPFLASDRAILTLIIEKWVRDESIRQDPKYLVVQASSVSFCGTGHAENDDECMSRPGRAAVDSPPIDSDFRASFESRNAASVSIRDLVRRDDVKWADAAELSAIFARGFWREFNKVYPDASGLLRVSLPGYSPNRETAVIYAEFACDGLCGSGQLYVVALKDGEWTVLQERRLFVS
jgi:hypothetical protein